MTPVECDRVIHAMWALAGTVHEVRVRMRHGEPRTVRAVVAFPDPESVPLFEQVVLENGATMETVPGALARGIPVPVNAACFSVPVDVGRRLIALG